MAAPREDPMIEEVRRIRADVAAECGHDLDRLAEHLRQVERDFTERRGIYAGITPEAAMAVPASWGNLSGPADDPLIDEIREIRQTGGRQV